MYLIFECLHWNLDCLDPWSQSKMTRYVHPIQVPTRLIDGVDAIGPIGIEYQPFRQAVG